VGRRDVVLTAHGLIEDRDHNLVLVIVVEDNEVPGHVLCRWQNLLLLLARYGVPVRSKRSSKVH
jgi:hypothetical protein